MLRPSGDRLSLIDRLMLLLGTRISPEAPSVISVPLASSSENNTWGPSAASGHRAAGHLLDGPLPRLLPARRQRSHLAHCPVLLGPGCDSLRVGRRRARRSGGDRRRRERRPVAKGHKPGQVLVIMVCTTIPVRGRNLRSSERRRSSSRQSSDHRQVNMCYTGVAHRR